jgi:hypothetical protein
MATYAISSNDISTALDNLNTLDANIRSEFTLTMEKATKDLKEGRINADKAKHAIIKAVTKSHKKKVNTTAETNDVRANDQNAVRNANEAQQLEYDRLQLIFNRTYSDAIDKRQKDINAAIESNKKQMPYIGETEMQTNAVINNASVR